MIFLTVLGTILKIIGIVLLGILLLLLLFLLVFLFVPLRYRAKVVRDGEKLLVKAQVSYIFRLVRLPVSFEDGKLCIRLSVFGITLYSNDGGGRGKKKKAGKKRGRKARGEGTKERNQLVEPDKTKEMGGLAEKGGEAAKKTGGTNGSAEFAKGRIKQVSRLAKEGGEAAETDGETEAAKSAKEVESLGNGSQESMSDTEALLEMLDSPAKDDTENAPGLPATQEEDIPRGPRKLLWKFWQFIKGLVNKGKMLLEKIYSFIRDIREKISAIRTKASDIKRKGQLVVEFLRDEENKNGIKYAWKSIFQLLKHVFPYKIEGDIVFATGAPYSTGRALSALGILYPLYAKSLRLSADFTADHFKLDGNILIKGRVRFGTVLWIALKLWRKGKIMHLLSAAKELKKELTAPIS